MKVLLSILRPLSYLRIIAEELTVLRQLYEAELGDREKPIYRVTEKAKKSDTEISYAGVAVEKKPRWKVFAAVEEDEEVEEIEERDEG